MGYMSSADKKFDSTSFIFGGTFTTATFVAALGFFAATSGGFGGYSITKDQVNARITMSEEYDNVPHFVTRVIDPDSIVVNGNQRVRLLGIDSPETGDCYYEEAKEYATRLMLGREVLLRKDSRAVEDNGRLLRYVFLYNSDPMQDNLFVNRHLIRYGYGVTYHEGSDRRYERVLGASMGTARKEKRGLHGACEEKNIDEVTERPGCVLKGNRGPAGDIYYAPECGNYEQIRLKQSEGD